MLYTIFMSRMSYKSNKNVLYSCKYHVVWCPKYRRKVLVEPIDARLKQIIEEVCQEHNFEILSMEVMPDHVHLLWYPQACEASQRTIVSFLASGVSSIG